MSKHNYSQYSNKSKDKNSAKARLVPADFVDDEVVSTENATADVKMAVETVEPVEPAKVAKPKTVTGTVVNCAKLNVRVAPVAGAEVVTIIEADTKVMIDPRKSNDEWFSVSVDNGTEGFNGYCMKKFVEASL